MKSALSKLPWLFVFTVFACSTVRVLNTEPADGFRLSNYQTYNFYDLDASGDTDTLSQAFKERVDVLKNEIARQLEKHGLRRRDSQPDLLVNLGIVVDEKVQTRRTDIRSDPPTYIGQRRYSWKSREVEVGRYREGTVTVHLVDRAQNQMVWRGVAESVIPGNTNKLQKNIAKGAEALFSRISTDERTQ